MEVVRISPISAPEKELLMALVEDEKVLKNHGTDGKLVLLKRQAWARITQIFNAQNLGPKRDEYKLKKCWERLRVKAKHDKAVANRENRKTGGGPKVADVGEDSLKILAILGDEVNDLGCPFDSDATPSKAKSHRQGRLIRFIKSVRATSYSSREVVTLEVGEELEPQQPVIIKTRSVAVAGHSGYSAERKFVIATPRSAAVTQTSGPAAAVEEPIQEMEQTATTPAAAGSGGTGKKTRGRRAIFDGDCPPSVRKDEQYKTFMQKRERLLDMQLKEMEIKIEEAELLKVLRVEEAKIRKEIALRTLAKLDSI